MPEKINYNFNIAVDGGPSVSVQDVLNVNAYDKVSVVVPNNNTPMDVELEPEPSDKVKFLLIKSDIHAKVKYNTTGGTPIDLDRDQVIVGSSLVKLLGDVKKMQFTNAGDKEANIEIIVGRGDPA